MENLDEYMNIFEQAQERGLAPTSDLTSEGSVNVPFPVLPGALGDVMKPSGPTPAHLVLAPARQSVVRPSAVRTNASLVQPQSVVRSAPIRTNAAVAPSGQRVHAPLLIPGGTQLLRPASKAAGSAAPLPSPASGSPSPSVPDFPPLNATPSSGGPVTFDMNANAPPIEPPTFNAGPITTNANANTSPPGCPACPSAGVGGGTLLLLVAASLYAGHLLTQKTKTVA